MTKKDYIALAEALAWTRGEPSANGGTIDMVARQMADVFARDNGNFDRSRWYAAAGVEASRW